MKLQFASMFVGQGASRSPLRVLVAVVLFCAATFIVSSARAYLNPETEFELFHPKRILLIGAGAIVFGLTISGSQGPDRKPARFTRMAMAGMSGLAVLFALALGFDAFVTGEKQDMAARNLRWILLWSGYFGTGLAAWLAVHYRAALASESRQKASDDGEPGPVQGAKAGGSFWVKTGRQTVQIAQACVEWIEAEGNYVRIHGHDGADGLIRSTLAAVESQLKDEDFIRIHRSALCRRSAIRGYRRKPSGAMLALLASGAEVPMGRNFARQLVQQLPRPGEEGSSPDDTVSRHGSEARAA